MKVTIGRIVRYVEAVDSVGTEWPAIVTAVHSDTVVSLQVFRLGDVVARTSIPYSKEPAAGTWHWPDR